MNELVKKIEEILEVEKLDLNKKFIDYDEWDSLTGLSLLAMMDSDYNVTMTTSEILGFNTIQEFCERVLNS